MGKLIVIEGLDGSGKSTQLDILVENLLNNGINCKKISFPDYNDPSSTLIKMYLGGEFGTDPLDVNAYAASLFYAVDRYASFKKHWKPFYDNNGVVVSGRYVTSNAIHQMSKLNETEWNSYLDWLFDLEYNKTAIPKPDMVIMLDMPPEISQKMLSNRYSGDETKKDIHERNVDYLINCRKAAIFAAKHSNWKVINCANGENPRTIEDIANEIYGEIVKIL